MQIKEEQGRKKTRDSVKMTTTPEYYVNTKSRKQPLKKEVAPEEATS